MSDPTNTFFSDADLESRWGRKRGYCAELRAQGRGPRFTRLSPRVVRYRLDHVREYEESNTFQSNAEAMAAEDNGDFPRRRPDWRRVNRSNVPGDQKHQQSQRK